MPRTFFLFGLGFFLLALSACDSPSNVGINLVEQGGEPSIVRLIPGTFRNEPLQDVTGNGQVVQRPMTGRVDDPALGTITAMGDVDFVTPIGVTDAFRSGTVTSVTLSLVPIYSYGDTLSTITVALNEFPEEWESVGARADTVIQTVPGSITEFTFTPQDTLVTVELPQSWIADNDSTLRSTLFNTSFHGFQFDPSSGNAVVAFSPSQTLLNVVSSGDTTAYTLSKTLTGITRGALTQDFPDRIVLQDGAGPGIEVQFDFASVLKDQAVNNIQFRFQADSLTLAEDTPPNFVRPQLREIALFGVTEDQQAVEIDSAVRTKDGVYVFDTNNLIDVIQNMLLNNSVFTRFRLGVPPQRNSVNPVLLYGADSPMHPEAVITVTSLSN